jgi:hypothetical protein
MTGCFLVHSYTGFNEFDKYLMVSLLTALNTMESQLFSRCNVFYVDKNWGCDLSIRITFNNVSNIPLKRWSNSTNSTEINVMLCLLQSLPGFQKAFDVFFGKTTQINMEVNGQCDKGFRLFDNNICGKVTFI